MTNIEHLLQKYKKPTPAERYSNTYQNKVNAEKTRKHRHLILDELLNETPFQLKEYQKQQIRFWIDTFNPYFKDFHRQASNETIILAFIMIQRKQQNKRLKVERFKISRKYKLTNAKFITIQNQLIFELMRTTPLTYTQSKQYDHEILIKKGE